MSGETLAEAALNTYWEISKRLKAARIWHQGQISRYDAISILAHVPGEYWEIDVKDDGTIDFEVYSSRESDLGGVEELNRAIEHINELNKE
jgi:hypothetical protein